MLRQIAHEAEAAMFHRQLFEELRRTSHLTRDPTESVAIGAVEASFKCCASAIIVLTKTGRSETPFITLKAYSGIYTHTLGSNIRYSDLNSVLCTLTEECKSYECKCSPLLMPF